MIKAVLDVDARFQLERLCDCVHPAECGGYLLGSTIDNYNVALVKAVFPIPNISKTPNTEYRLHDWGDYWGKLYHHSSGLDILGDFHSHPNGTIPSSQDMEAHRDNDLHIWVVHHGKGLHTFMASKGLDHLSLELASQPLKETETPRMLDGSFNLGDLSVDDRGVLRGSDVSIELLKLGEKQRRVIVAILAIGGRNNRYNRISANEIAKFLKVSLQTVHNWSILLVQNSILTKKWGEYRLAYKTPFYDYFMKD